MIHRPRREYLDVDKQLILDRDGALRPLTQLAVGDEAAFYGFALEPRGRLQALHTVVIPKRGLRVCTWQVSPGQETDRDFDYYIDFCQVTTSSGRLEMVDDYLDIKVWHRLLLQPVDADELMAATVSGYIDKKAAASAIHRMGAVAAELGRHGFDVPEWLRQQGIENDLVSGLHAPVSVRVRRDTDNAMQI